MANKDYLKTLEQGAEAGNEWRQHSIESRADLSDANLKGANLMGANLIDVDLMGADLTNGNLNDASLTNASQELCYGSSHPPSII